MSAKNTRRLLLWAAATDSTFEWAQQNGRRVLLGKCIHCGRNLTLESDGKARDHATVEHIVPRHHGGTDDLENLAIACARCNQDKGARHDSRDWNDPGLQGVIATLQARRRRRMRAPLEDIDLPPWRQNNGDNGGNGNNSRENGT